MNGHFRDIFGAVGQTTARHGAAFAVVSGDFPRSGIALPFGNRKVRAAALKQLLLYKGRLFWNRVKIGFLQAFNCRFVWNIVFREKFVLSLDTNGENLHSFLSRQLSGINGQLSDVRGQLSDVLFSIYVGSRKFILPLFGAESGKMLGVAKVYFPGEESSDYGENEAKALEYLGSFKSRHFRFPKVLAKDRFRGSLVLILSSPQDITSAASITEPHIDFLKQLSENTGTRTSLARSGFSSEMQKEVDFIRSSISGSSGSVERLFGEAMRALSEREFTFSLVKREFPFFEMLSSVDSRASNISGHGSSVMFVIDWEQARFGFPPLFDLYSLLISSGRFKRGDYVELYRKNIKDLFFSGNGRVAALVEDMAGFWGIGREEAYRFFILFLIDQLYVHLHAGHQPSAERVIALLEEMDRDEGKFLNAWLKF